MYRRIELKKGYLVSPFSLPYFNKRKDGLYYAKFSLDSYKIADESGYELDSTVLSEISAFKKKLKALKASLRHENIEGIYKHQQIAVSLILNNKEVALFMEQGTGKTLSALKAIEILYLRGEVSKVLVVTLKSVIREWEEQAHKFNINVPVNNLKKNGIRNGINLINYESVWRGAVPIVDMVVLDESQKIQSTGTKVSRFMHSLHSDRKVIMTGTAGEKPEAYFGQFKYLEPVLFGESLTMFKELFTNFDRETGAVWGLKKSMRNKFWARVHSLSYWITKKECLDLPEQIMEYNYIELPKAILKGHKDLEKEFIAEIDGKVVVTKNKLSAVSKCHMLTQGILDGEIVHNEKIKALRELDIQSPFAIFTNYIKEVEELLKVFPKAGVVDGSRNDAERFKTGKTDVLIVNYASGATGLNLQRASTVVFYSLTYSYTLYSQALSRIHRIGQTEKCVYIHLIAEDTIDERILRALQNKEDFITGGRNNERKHTAKEHTEDAQ
jgi:SNF2 family DNA or RNA helicase